MADSFLEGRVNVLVGDITAQDVTALVNAANSTLLGGSGVDGAIHRAGGPQILAECRQIRETTHPNGLPTGEAVITTGGNLTARYVIHTVGPIYGRNPSAKRNCSPLAIKTRYDSRASTQFHPSHFPQYQPELTVIPRPKLPQSPQEPSRNSSPQTAKFAKCAWCFSNRATRGCFWSARNSSRLSRFTLDNVQTDY